MAWCKIIVTTSFYITRYNSFAPGPLYIKMINLKFYTTQIVEITFTTKWHYGTLKILLFTICCEPSAVT